MKIKFLSLLLFVCFFATPLRAKVCNIFIHGYTNNGEGYWGDLPRQVVWDSKKNHQDAAVEVASKILEEAKSCDKGDPIILRSHSYGASVTFYVLAQGYRFINLYPDHDYVKVQKLSTAFYSYSGAFNGTPVMNLICGNNFIGLISSYFNKTCVNSLTTKSIFHPSNEVTNPGIPVYLVYTTNRNAYANTTGTIIALSGISFWKWLKGNRNQNDSVLPTYSTRGCSNTKALLGAEENCEKINSYFFKDFIFDENFTHNEYLDDKEFIIKMFE